MAKILQFELDIDNKTVPEIAVDLTLFASLAFHEKCGSAWAEAMAELQTALQRHVQDNEDLGTE